MKILLVIDTKLPALRYGGTERVMWYLGKELSRLGHEVAFLSQPGSECGFASIIELDPNKEIARQIPEDVDVIHFNNEIPRGVNKPYLVTWHINSVPGNLDLNSVFVSRDHAQRYGSASYVYNGLDWDDYGKVDFQLPRTYYHFLGKAAWKVKNVKGAIDVVKALGNERIEVLGGYRLNIKMGFRFTFTPKAHFAGMVGGERKNQLLKGSKGLIFPVMWDEPFGLAITESLYCGAPVFGTPHGSLPELVTPEVGFLTDSCGAMVNHLKNDYHYSSKICHEYASDCFNARQMALGYLDKYERILNGQKLNEQPPYLQKPDTRYPWCK